MLLRMFLVTLALAAQWISAGDAQSQPAPRSVYVRVFGASAIQSMGDLDGYVAENLDALLILGASRGEILGFGPTGMAGAEAGYMLDRRWSLGISVSENETNETSLFGSILFDIGGNSLDASITDLTGNTTFWSPGSRRFFAGAEAGVGFGKLTETFDYGAYDGSTLHYRGEWDGTGLVVGAFAGYQREFRSGFLAAGKLGFKHRNLGKMDGQTTVTESSYSSFPTGVTPGPITGSSGRELASDFSCLYLSLGIGWSFGGTR